jgi:hypothetical protein
MGYTDEFGKRRVTSWRMTEATVKEFTHVYKDAVKVEGSLGSQEHRGARPATGNARPRSHSRFSSPARCGVKPQPGGSSVGDAEPGVLSALRSAIGEAPTER